MKFIQRVIDNLIEKYIEPKIKERVQQEVFINLNNYNHIENSIGSHDSLIKDINDRIDILEKELRKHIELEENLAADSTSQLVINLLEDSIYQIKNEGLSISEINRIMNTLNTYKNEKVNVSLNRKENPISRVKLI